MPEDNRISMDAMTWNMQPKVLSTLGHTEQVMDRHQEAFDILPPSSRHFKIGSHCWKQLVRLFKQYVQTEALLPITYTQVFDKPIA